MNQFTSSIYYNSWYKYNHYQAIRFNNQSTEYIIQIILSCDVYCRRDSDFTLCIQISNWIYSFLITYLLNPLSQLVEALFRKRSEGTSNCDIIWNNIECTTSMKHCNRHNLRKHALCKENKTDCVAFNKQWCFWKQNYIKLARQWKSSNKFSITSSFCCPDIAYKVLPGSLEDRPRGRQCAVS